MRKTPRFHGLGPVIALFLMHSPALDAQEAREVALDAASEAAFLSWSDLADGQALSDPGQQLVIVEEPSFGVLEIGTDGLTYLPAEPFRSTGGDTFSYYFDLPFGAPRVMARLVSSPFEHAFADDMESGNADAWSRSQGALRFVKLGPGGRSLEAVATPGDDVYLERGDVPEDNGTGDQNTQTVMTVVLDEPPNVDDPSDGEAVVWSGVDKMGRGSRVRLRRLSGILEARAESCLLDATPCSTDWLGIVEVTTLIRVDHTTYPGNGASVTLIVGSSVSFLGAADELSSDIEHRLGLMSMTGLDGLRVYYDDFATGRVVRRAPRAFQTDSFEDAAFAADWDLSGASQCVLAAAAAISGYQGLEIDLGRAAADKGESGLRFDLAEPTASLTLKAQIDTSALSLPNRSEVVVVLEASADELFSPEARLLQLQLRYADGTYQVLARSLDDDGSEIRSPWWPLAPGPHSLVLGWRADPLGGELGLWVDGLPVARRRGFPNAQQTLTALRLGAYRVGEAPVSWSGRLAIDSFAAWQ